MKNIRLLINKWNRRRDPVTPAFALPFQVKTTQVSPALQCFLIQHRETFEIPYTALTYLTDLSAQGRSPQTVKNIAYSLAYLYSFASHQGIGLNALIALGQTLPIRLVGTLRDFIRAQGNPKLSLTPRAGQRLGPGEVNRHLALILGYLKWGLNQYSDHPEPESARLAQQFRATRIATPRKEEDRVLPEAAMRLLDEAFDVKASPVWKDELERLRNRCIFGLADETAGRISDILGMQVGDVGTGSVSVVHFVKRDGNVHDTRVTKARNKTFSRSLPISRELHELLIRYIRLRPGKSRSPMLFLSHQGRSTGQPLSLRRAHALMEDIKRHYAADARWPGTVNWHDIRHTTLYRLYWQLADKENRKELLKQIAGHISDSVFNRYHRMALMEDARQQLAEINARPNHRSVQTSARADGDIEAVQTLDDLLEAEEPEQ